MTGTTLTRTRWPDRRAVWRWHFYASLFCMPFVLWLAVTGTIYLFRPQIEAAIDRPYAHVASAVPRMSAGAQVAAALAAAPGSRLAAYEVPPTQESAVRILVNRGQDQFRVYVNPTSLGVVKLVNEDDRFTRKIFHLHGELLAGDRGSMLVELAACWTIVMIVTGLILWWPRNARGLGGVLYPRFGKAFFWRDLHACTGMWISFCALFLLFTGLPWTKNWGGYLKEVRAIMHLTDAPQDWTTGRSSELAQRVATDSDHAEHVGRVMRPAGAPTDLAQLDKMLASANALNFAPPVLITPPREAGEDWSVRSDAANRPLRADAKLDANTGAVLSVKPFSARHPIDRAVGYGVAAHEGQLFGWPNQLLGLITALGLITLVVSGAVRWLGRRRTALFAAPERIAAPHFSWRVALGLVIVTALIPTLGISALAVIAAERLLLRRIPFIRDGLGLGDAAARA